MSGTYSALHKAHLGDAETRILNAYKCLKHLKRITPLGDVVDFGCGIGAWLIAAQKLGATSVRGVEGEWVTTVKTLVPSELIEIHDLSADSIDYHKQFDVALTIEVAEHLPGSSADSFCLTLVRSAPLIVFSAAVPGQGGVDHHNEQPLSYWVGKFWNLGYVPLELFRPYIASDTLMYKWLKNNLIAFVDYGYLTRSPALLPFARPLSDFERYPRLSWPTGAR